MRGRKPKSDELRQRRNKPRDTVLDGESVGRKQAPQLLPKDREWNDLTRKWWTDIWHSPMASGYVESDKYGLYMLAMLVDQYWTDPDPKLASEIRLQRGCFGLSPIDRRRLQWEVKRAENAEGRKPPGRKPSSGNEDPRAMLELVK